MRFSLALVLFAAFAAGCSDNDTDPKTAAKTVEINILEIPPSGTVDDEIQIHVRTVPHNGCWYDLQVEFTQQDDRHFILQATGKTTDNGNGMCPENLVVEDTIIRLTPPVSGKYYFKANAEPFAVLRDTVEVEE